MTEFIWVKDKGVIEHCWNCIDVDTNERLAFITQQADYQNRGHFMGMVDIEGIGPDDSWPNYYMRWDHAMSEIAAFLDWRLNKVRCEQPPACLEGIQADPKSTFWDDAQKTRIEVDLEMYGIAFKSKKTGEALDPKDIVVFTKKPDLKAAKTAGPTKFVHYDTAGGRCGLCGRQDCSGGCFKG